MSQQYPYQYGHYGPPPQQSQQQSQPQSQPQPYGYPAPGHYPPQAYNSYGPPTHPSALNSQAISHNSYNYNAGLIPGLHVGVPQPALPNIGLPTFPPQGSVPTPNSQGSFQSTFSAQPNNTTSWEPPKPPASSQATSVSKSLATNPRSTMNDDVEEGELSEGQFEDLYEPRGSDQTSSLSKSAPTPSASGLSRPVSAQDTPEGGFYGQDEDEGEIITDDSRKQVSAAKVREGSGSYSPFLSPREIRTENTTPQLAAGGDDKQPSTSRPVDQPTTVKTTISKQTDSSTNASTVTNGAPSSSVMSMSLHEAKKEAQKAILQLLSVGVKFQDYIDEGFDEDIIRGLYSDLNLDIPKKKQDLDKAPEQQAQPIGTVNPQAPKSTLDSKAEERKDRIARLLAAKAAKPSTGSNSDATPAPEKPAAAQSLPQQSGQQTSPASAPKLKAWGEKELLIQKKIAALQKSREAQMQKTTTTPPQPASVNGGQISGFSQQPVSSSVEVGTPKPGNTEPPSQSKEQQDNNARPSSVPGPSILPTTNLGQRSNQRKRPVAADFVEYSSSIGPLKRPFGHERQEASLVIDVSDESDEEMDMDEDMDLDSPSEGNANSRGLPYTRQGPSIRDFPPLSDIVSSRQFSSPTPISHTPPGGLVNGKKREAGLDLKEREKQLEEMKRELERRIAEAEAKRKAKNSSVGSQTPAQSSHTPEVKGNESFHQQPQRREESVSSPVGTSKQSVSGTANILPKGPVLPPLGREGKAERRDRIVSLELPQIDESLEHKVKRLAQMREESQRLELEISQELSKKRQLAEELEQINAMPSESASQENGGDTGNSSSASDRHSASVTETPFVPDQSDSDSDVSMDEDGSSNRSSPAGTSHQNPEESHQDETEQDDELEAPKTVADEPRPITNSPSLFQNTVSVDDQQTATVPESKADEASEIKADNITNKSEFEAHSDANIDDTAPMELETGLSSPALIDTPVDHSGTDEESAEEDEEGRTSPSDEIGSATQNRVRTQDRTSELEATDASPINTTGFRAYQSPLRYFTAYRYHPNYQESVAGGLKSLTYLNRIDPNKEFCPYELEGRPCPVPCSYQHFASVTMPDDQILVELGSADGFNGETKTLYIQGLREVLAGFRTNKVKDFDTIARGIVEYRARFLGDKSKILNLEGVTL